jgi:hypothetical protein
MSEYFTHKSYGWNYETFQPDPSDGKTVLRVTVDDYEEDPCAGQNFAISAVYKACEILNVDPVGKIDHSGGSARCYIVPEKTYSVEMRENNGGTYLLLLRGVDIASVWTCTSEDVENFVSDSDPADWDDQRLYDHPNPQAASDYGDLIATRQANGDLVVDDEAGYAERLLFFKIQA